MIEELVLKNRSYRRFQQNRPITRAELYELIDIARLTPSAGNLQLTRYIISCTPERNAAVFDCLRWAAYYRDWAGPEEGERPAAYIVMLAPEKADTRHDEGIKGQTIMLAAAQRGMGGCFIANIDKARLAGALDIPAGYVPSLVLALGYPAETVLLHEVKAGSDIKYYRDENDAQNVPKLRLEDIIIG